MKNRKATIVEVVQFRVTGDFAVQFFRVDRRVDSKPVHTIPLLEYEAREIAGSSVLTYNPVRYQEKQVQKRGKKLKLSTVFRC